MKEKIQIIILSRDRPKYFKESLDSVLNQKCANIEIKVSISDNSEGDEISELVEKNYNNHNIEYIRRFPAVSVIKHHQLVISECKETYIVIFHDDDIMHSNYIKTMLPFIQRKNIVAVGCNAFLFKKNTLESKYKFHHFAFCKEFSSEKDFLVQYTPKNGGVAPFPSYMYRTKILQKVPIATLHGGIYADVVLLSSLLRYGLIIWLPNVLMSYRVHDSRVSSVESMAGNISLFNYMSKQGLNKHENSMLIMRYTLWLRWFIRQDKKNIFSWKSRVVFKFLVFKLFYFSRRMFFWKVFFLKVLSRHRP